MVYTNKKQLVDTLKMQLATRDRQALKGLVTIYGFQTDEEQEKGNTLEYNQMGFTGLDGQFLSSLAEQYIARGSLSPKQIVYVKKAMPKYAGQLIKHSISVGKIAKIDGVYIFVQQNN